MDKRDDKAHRDAIKKIQDCATKTSIAKAESSAGCRYSTLTYFDAPQMLCIDPMHNLFLGISNNFVIDQNLVSKSNFKSIQEFID